MKKIFYLFSMVVLGSLLVSCSLNEHPTFDDKDAFAAFSNASMKVSEDAGTLNIPVNVTSLNGVTTTISYEFVNGTAVQGVDFEDASGSGTLSFSPGESKKEIAVRIIPRLGTFTGDLSFSVRFKSTGDVAMGMGNVCNVTITDTDHPLSALLGTYTAKAADYEGEEYEFAVTFVKDESDVSKIWIHNLCPYFASYGYTAPNYNKIYGVVSDDLSQIVIPNKQSTGYETVVFNGLSDPDPEAGSDADILIQILDGGKTLVLPNAWGTYNPGDGFWSLFAGGLRLTK